MNIIWCIHKLTAAVKKTEVKLNMKIDGVANDDRERAGNTVAQKEQSCGTGTEHMRRRGGKMTDMKEKGNEAIERGCRKVSDGGNVNG